MTILSKPLRKQLETTIKQAREIAEDAVKEAIARMGVAEAEAPAHLSDDNVVLRRRLRAHSRTLGDTRDTARVMTTARLQDEASYEIWHRMLFGRFLAERGLLIHPELGAAMSVAELRDLAKEEGAADEWALAERYAAPGLPGVFKPDDPVLALPIAPEFSKRLRALLSDLPEEVFTSDDSLGWTYQFWRASEKDAVNAAGGKIGAAELPAVTQLFTEPYMVKFLLQNTLGAWWAGKVLARDPDLARDAADEDALREACAIPGATWEYLRFVRSGDEEGRWRPAAGTFSGWPTRAAEITYCDPCCGSGHFLVEAFGILAALRRSEEGITAAQAAIVVLQENLHGLELDGRCVQIAAFNVALVAWKLAGASARLPSPHVAWVGAPPPMSRVEMAALANGDTQLRHAMEALHDQFIQAPILGSLLQIGARDLLDFDLRERGTAALSKLRESEPERVEGAIAARGLLDASNLLAKTYVLIATNVPFLGRGRQSEALTTYSEETFPAAKADLATTMLERMKLLSTKNGSIASVTPQNWLFLNSYIAMRRTFISVTRLSAVVTLGSRAFEAIGGEVVTASLIIFSNDTPSDDTTFFGLDASNSVDPADKSNMLMSSSSLSVMPQLQQLKNPDARITPSPVQTGILLSSYCNSYTGLGTGDIPHYIRCFWELGFDFKNWTFLQSAIDSPADWGGCSTVVAWDHTINRVLGLSEEEKQQIHNQDQSGQQAWDKLGIAVNSSSNLKVCLFTGAKFEKSLSVLVPKDNQDLLAIYEFTRDPQFARLVREIDKKIVVANGTLVKVPFDKAHWQAVATAHFPEEIPAPFSNDPTQWQFHGHPSFADVGTELHVALARIAGYRWPAETSAALRISNQARDRIGLTKGLPEADSDGILVTHANRTSTSLADRLRAFLHAAYGEPLSPHREQALVRATDMRLDKKEARDISLEGWLKDRAFRQHCILFQQRPLLWHIWDGMREGFSAFLNYHLLSRATLDRLTYTLLGDWIRTAKAEGNTARLERAEQLQQKLAKIIEGESPADIFVRWKPLARQPLGWDPDLDDGIRLNIRPFMTAGILREQPKGISWNKDRGTDASSAPWYELGLRYGGKRGDRINDHHTTLAEKRAARGTS